MEEATVDPPGLLVRPAPQQDTGTSVLLLAGSSGRIDEGRARVLARPRVLARMRKVFAGTFAVLGARLAVESR